MATYNPTITTTPGDEKALDAIVADVNAKRAAEAPPKGAITKAQYVQAVAQSLPAKYRKQYLDDFRDRAGIAMQTATLVQLTQVAAALGITE